MVGARSVLRGERPPRVDVDDVRGMMHVMVDSKWVLSVTGFALAPLPRDSHTNCKDIFVSGFPNNHRIQHLDSLWFHTYGCFPRSFMRSSVPDAAKGYQHR